MSKRRLLITGSQGFVGGALSAKIQESDDFQIVDFLDPEDFSRPDIRNNAAVERAIDHAKPDTVIHLAAVAAPREAKQDPSAAWMINVIGTLNIAHALLRLNPKAHLIWSGSSEAYGESFNHISGPIGEMAPLSPMTAYGATKAASDLMLRQMAHDGLNVTVFRPFNHTGAGQNASYVVPAFAEQIAKIEVGLQEPFIKVGNLTAKRDFLDVCDVINAYLCAARQVDKAIGKSYNISTGQPVSIEYLLKKLLGMSSSSIEVTVDPDRYVENTVPVASGSYQKIQDELGWQPSTNIEKTLENVLNYQRHKLTNDK